MITVAMIIAVGAAPIARADVGGFNGGDGTEAGGDCVATLDWSCLSAADLSATLDPQASSDLAFTSSSKENQPDGWTIGVGPVGTTKAEVNGNWSYSYTDPTFSTNYLALAFNRASGAGDSYFAFELNQSDATYTNSAGTSVICRANGDVLISFDIQPSSAVDLVVYKWTWDTGSTPCTAGATGSFSTPVTLPAGAGELAVNAGPVANSLSASTLGGSFATGTFGEAAINLNALASAVAPLPQTCEFFNHMQLTSRSSSSISSSMEDFVDGGNLVARACNTGGGGGGGGGGCSPGPSVAISSPADNSTDSTNAVTLAGTSDQPEIEIVDGQHVVGNVPVSGGTWTLALNDVANGPHTYTAIATDSAGCTSTAAVHLNVQGPVASGGGPGGGHSGGGAAVAGGTTATAPACVTAAITLVDVYPVGRKARLIGVAPLSLAGRSVKILAVWNHKVLGRTKIKSDGTFAVTVRQPPSRTLLTGKGAYRAKVGSKTTRPLKFARRVYNTALQAKGTKITFRGIVVAPLATPVRQIIIRGWAGCHPSGRGRILARVTPARSGRFKVIFTVPKSMLDHAAIVVRAQTKVGRVAHGARGGSRHAMTAMGLARTLPI